MREACEQFHVVLGLAIQMCLYCRIRRAPLCGPTCKLVKPLLVHEVALLEPSPRNGNGVQMQGA